MKKKVILGILVIFLIALVPLFALKDAEFGGSDDAGSQVVEEVDSSYEPWATPILERIIEENFRGKWKAFSSVYRPVSALGSSPLSWAGSWNGENG